MSRFFLFVLLGELLSPHLAAQFQNPSDIKWLKVKSPNFTVVCPENVIHKGIKTAGLLESAYHPVSRTMTSHIPKTPVFLFNQSVVSNGYMTLAPRHVGFFTTPSQNILDVGGTDWLQTLAVHEFRHTVQLDKLNDNFMHFLGSAFGDYGRLYSAFLTVPLWAMEGDAIVSETTFSTEGRGRLPSFVRDFRAMENEGIRYSYNKAHLGSYKDYIPNHYHLGYLLTAHVRSNYGNEAWSSTFERTTKLPGPYRFSRSLKKYTGFSAPKTYRNSLNECNAVWKNQSSLLHTKNLPSISPETNPFYTNYKFPFKIEDDAYIALKSGLDDPTQIVIFKNGSEKTLVEINPVDRIHSNGRLVTWAEEKADIRWGQRSYSDIVLFDPISRVKRYVSNNEKFFAPALSKDGKYIATIRYGDDMQCKLIRVCVENGEALELYCFDEGEFARMPSWSEDDSRIVMTVTKGQKRKIASFNVSEQKITDLTGLTTEGVSNPVIYKDYILFNSSVSGIDAIYAMEFSTGERFLLSTGEYGTYNPSVNIDGSGIVFENYTVSGMQVSLLTEEDIDFVKVMDYEDKNPGLFSSLYTHDEDASLFNEDTDFSDAGFEVSKYHQMLGAFSFHSWHPVVLNKGIGVKVISNDILNTTEITAGLDYYRNNQATRQYLDVKYSRFFPVLYSELSFGQAYADFNDTTVADLMSSLDEKVFGIGMELPFNLSKGIYTTNLSLSGGYKFINAHFTDKSSQFYNMGFDFTALSVGVKFNREKQMSYRELYPKYGQSFSLDFWKKPFSRINESMLIGKVSVFLPGLTKNHSLNLRGDFQRNTSLFKGGVYKLSYDTEFTRGYEKMLFDKFINGTVIYTLPLLYPDLAIGPVLYLKRVFGSFFYDQGLVLDNNNRMELRSIGVDLNFEINPFRLQVLPIETGIRCSYIPELKNFSFELLIFRTIF